MSEKYYVDFDKLPEWMTHDMARDLIFKVANDVDLYYWGSERGVNIGYKSEDDHIIHNCDTSRGAIALPIFEFCEWLSRQGSAKKVEKTALQQVKEYSVETDFGKLVKKAILEIADKVGL